MFFFAKHVGNSLPNMSYYSWLVGFARRLLFLAWCSTPADSYPQHSLFELNILKRPNNPLTWLARKQVVLPLVRFMDWISFSSTPNTLGIINLTIQQKYIHYFADDFGICLSDLPGIYHLIWILFIILIIYYMTLIYPFWLWYVMLYKYNLNLQGTNSTSSLEKLNQFQD